MKLIDHAIEHVEEELEGAKEYAEKYVEFRSRGDTTRANKYKEMANDELRHASFVYDFALSDIEGVKKVYTISVTDEEKWTKCHKHYVECSALIRQMLM
jgi:septation ring formation regulator EzrA